MNSNSCLLGWAGLAEHTLSEVGEETGKEKLRTGRAVHKVPCHLDGFSAITGKREIKIPPLRLLRGEMR